MDKEELSLLPNTVRELIWLVGEHHAMALVQAYGGGDYIDIPSKAKQNHPIAEYIGLDALEILVDALAGIRIYIPACSSFYKHLRNKKIIEKYGEGRKVAELAREYGLCAKQIRAILNKSS